MRPPRPDWFLTALVAAVALAAIWPAPGVTDGPLHADLVSRYGIALVFFLYGLTLAPEKLRAGLGNWRLHLLVQAATFLLFPALVLAAAPAARPLLPAALWTGFFYVAALPSTVSSSVAMTSLARGNVPAAIFNASLSSLIGVVATPLWIAWYLHAQGSALPLGPVILKIVLLVLLPTAIGQALHRPLLGWSRRHGARIKLADRIVILVIVYNSFADSVAGGVWSRQPLAAILLVAAGSLLLFGAVYGLVSGAARLLGFDREDRIAAVFCGSKKSLATGAPLAPILFGAGPATGLILTPLIIFHFLQLVIVGVIAGREGRRAI